MTDCITRLPKQILLTASLGLSLLLAPISLPAQEGPPAVPATPLKGEFGRVLIPEVLELKDFDVLPRSLFKKYDSRSIAESLVHRIRSSRLEMQGTEWFYEVGGPPFKLPINPETDTALHLYFEGKNAEGVVRDGFLNIHQRPELKPGPWKMAARDATEIKSSALYLAKKSKLGRDDPVNELRPKSAILEILLPEGKRPKTMGGVRYGEIVAVFKEEVKRRAMVTPFDSGAIGMEVSTMDRVQTEVRPLLDFDHLLAHPADRQATEYFEALIWGELDLRDVKEFMVPAGVDKKTLQTLIDSGVPVFEYVEITEGVPHNRYYKNYQRVRGKMISPGDPAKMKALDESVRASRTGLGCKALFGGLGAR